MARRQQRKSGQKRKQSKANKDWFDTNLIYLVDLTVYIHMHIHIFQEGDFILLGEGIPIDAGTVQHRYIQGTPHSSFFLFFSPFRPRPCYLDRWNLVHSPVRWWSPIRLGNKKVWTDLLPETRHEKNKACLRAVVVDRSRSGRVGR